MNLQPSLRRFLFGMAVGIFLAIICWSYSVFFLVPISLLQGILGCLVLAISCGIVATISDLDTLMDNLPFF